MMKTAKQLRASKQENLIDFAALAEKTHARLSDIKSRTVSPSQKKAAEKRLGESIIKKMKEGAKVRNDETNDIEIVKPSLSYFNLTVTRLRTAIKDFGHTHYTLKDECLKLCEKYTDFKDELLTLSNMDYRDAINAHKELLKIVDKKASLAKKEDKKALYIAAKKHIESLKIEPEILAYLKRTKEEKEKIETAKQKRIAAYLQHQINIDYEQTYNQMSECLASQFDWCKLAFGLAIASGRRFIELVDSSVGTFEKAKRPNEAIFTTTAKTADKKTYRIPLLVEFDKFIEILNRFRNLDRIRSVTCSKSYKKSSHFERSVTVNNSMQSTLNKEIAALTSGENSIHDARAKHARITYEEYASRERKAGRTPKSDVLFFKENLGHSDISTQNSYRRYVLKEQLKDREVKATQEQAEQSIATLNAQNNDRLQQLKDLKLDNAFNTLAFSKYLDFVIKEVEKDPGVKLSTSFIKTELGGNKGIICRFIAEIKKVNLDKAR